MLCVIAIIEPALVAPGVYQTVCHPERGFWLPGVHENVLAVVSKRQQYWCHEHRRQKDPKGRHRVPVQQPRQQPKVCQDERDAFCTLPDLALQIKVEGDFDHRQCHESKTIKQYVAEAVPLIDFRGCDVPWSGVPVRVMNHDVVQCVHSRGDAKKRCKDVFRDRVQNRGPGDAFVRGKVQGQDEALEKEGEQRNKIDRANNMALHVTDEWHATD